MTSAFRVVLLMCLLFLIFRTYRTSTYVPSPAPCSAHHAYPSDEDPYIDK